MSRRALGYSQNMADEKTIAVLCSAILNEFLLNPEVDESLEMEEFTELFPRKYRLVKLSALK